MNCKAKLAKPNGSCAMLTWHGQLALLFFSPSGWQLLDFLVEVALDLHVSSNLKEQHGILLARLAGQASSVLWWHELVMDATFLGMVGYELLEVWLFGVP